MEKVNLLNLYEEGIVKDGGHNISVPIRKANGEHYSGRTYAIPLKYLYYNEQNGRIGVSLSNYESANEKLVPGHNEEYNNIIQKMLVDDGEEKTKKDMDVLKRDIAHKGQGEPGYVLNDGRVIDGNRRFTAKRLLEQDPTITEVQYFEAVILDDLSVQNHNDQKKIKSLELQIQFGKIDKVDYNPIDRAIDAYKTIVVNTVMTVTEYKDYAGLKKKEVEKRLLEAELIVKFLSFVNSSPENYGLAKQLDLDGPLQDLVPKYKKIKNSKNSDQLLNSIFAKLLQARTVKENYKEDYRHVVQNIIGSKNEIQFMEEMEKATDIIVDTLDTKEQTKNNVDLFTRLNTNKITIKALAEVKTVSSKYLEKEKNLKERSKPIKLITTAINSIESIEEDVISDLPEDEKKAFYNSVKTLKKHIDSMMPEEVK